MSTDLEKREQSLTVLNPQTGEVLDLSSAEMDEIAEAMWELREAKKRYDAWLRQAGEEILRRFDRNAKWSGSYGQWDVKGSSPAPTRESDITPLMEELNALVDEGRISVEAAVEAIKTTVKHEPRWASIDAIRKLGGDVKDRIDKHIREVEKKRYPPQVELARPEPPK